MTVWIFSFTPVKSQHNDLKRQYYELQGQHQVEGDDHSRLLEEHRERYVKLEQFKQAEITDLKSTDSLTRLKPHVFIAEVASSL